MISATFETFTKLELPNMSAVLFKVISSHKSHERVLKNIEKDSLRALGEKNEKLSGCPFYSYRVFLDTVEPRLSGLVGTSVKSPDNRKYEY